MERSHGASGPECTPKWNGTTVLVSQYAHNNLYSWGSEVMVVWGLIKTSVIFQQSYPLSTHTHTPTLQTVTTKTWAQTFSDKGLKWVTFYCRLGYLTSIKP